MEYVLTSFYNAYQKIYDLTREFEKAFIGARDGTEWENIMYQILVFLYEARKIYTLDRGLAAQASRKRINSFLLEVHKSRVFFERGSEEDIISYIMENFLFRILQDEYDGRIDFQ